ncbi:MAG: hypothetical protein ACE364_09855 [Chlorobiota bacterium]
MKKYFLAILVLGLAFAVSCTDDNSTNPNELDGNTNIPISEVGSEFGVYLEIEGDNSGVLDRVRDSVVVSKRENGVTTVSAEFVIDEASVMKLDTILGLQNLSEEVKRGILDEYLGRFNAKLDTTDKQNITLKADLMGKITDKGIQDYVNSGGDTDKPFTLIKYDAKVGDTYSFTDDDGNTFTRKVVSKSTDDDYELGFLYIKVYKIEETQENDQLVDKITYYANHKFGLVGIEIEMKGGVKASSTILPWAVLSGF